MANGTGTISNLTGIMAKHIRQMSTSEINRYGTIEQALANPSGWRQMGMYITGGYGEEATDLATVGQGGTTVG